MYKQTILHIVDVIRCLQFQKNYFQILLVLVSGTSIQTPNKLNNLIPLFKIENQQLHHQIERAGLTLRIQFKNRLNQILIPIHSI